MKQGHKTNLWTIAVACGLFLSATPGAIAAEPSVAAVAGFNRYVAEVEARLARQHQSRDGFLAPVDAARLRRGELVIEKLTPASGTDLPGAMLHDWRGTAFVPGAKVADFERVLKDFAAFPKTYAPEVLQAKATSQGEAVQVKMRVRQKHVITVVMDISYDVAFARLDAEHGFSVSRSTRVSEISAAGTAKERALGPDDEHGFMWRLNSYWSFEERDGGLYMQIESVSLSRSIPTGLGWAIGPFVESVPRESLEFTLQSTSNALKQKGQSR